MLGIIGIKQLKIRCTLGFLPHEINPQDIYVDLEVETDISTSIKTGSLKDTLDYVQLTKLCEEIAINGGHLLLEKLANEMLKTVFERFNISWARLTIHKPMALPKAQAATITLQRTR